MAGVIVVEDVRSVTSSSNKEVEIWHKKTVMTEKWECERMT